MPDGPVVMDGKVAVPGRVLDLTYQGSLTTLLCDTPLGRLRSEIPTERLDASIDEGSGVALSRRQGDMRLLQTDGAN